MEKKKKILYVITIILYGLAAIAGILTVIGFLIKSSTLQIVGIPLLLVGFLAALVIEKFILKRE